ncbi:MAG: MFS transporter [Candidatus Krumholzibacteriia bacterium]
MKPWGIAFAFRALGSRNYRLFFAGQGISLIGTWMQQIAMIWLVYRLTHSAFLLGVVGFAGQIPTFLFAPFTGVLADRWNRHRTIVVTQTLALLQAATLAILVLTGTAQVWHLVALAVILGTINALDMPVRQSFIVQMIERKEDLGNAIALNSTMVTATRLLGPSIAGILIGAFGEGICFLVNAISYVAVIAALLAMRVAPPPARPANGRMIDGLKAGFAYVAGFAPVRDILLLLAFISLMGMPYYILMPVFAKDVLGGGAHTLGFLMGASGLGALVGTIYLATRKSIRGFGRIISAAATVFGVGLIAFSLSHVVWLSMILVFVAGLGMMAQMACSNTIIQTIVDDDKRGRVMSLFTMAFIGMAPFGSLFAGALASRIGAPNTLAIGGGFCVAGGIVFASRLKAMREVLHPIYRKMGIMPEISS